MNIDQDKQYETKTVEKATPSPRGGFELRFGEGACLFVSNDANKSLPEPGMPIRLYGRGFGSPVRGVATDACVYYYETEDEYEARFRREQEERTRKNREDFDANRDTFDKDVALLPLPFQRRINYFLDGVEDWGPKFGGYELFTCQEAVKIAETLKTGDAIDAFHELPFEEQQACVELADGHSGNTFGAACMLAKLYLTQPELVPKMHGALCPLVGCENYGCYAARCADEAEPKP